MMSNTTSVFRSEGAPRKRKGPVIWIALMLPYIALGASVALNGELASGGWMVFVATIILAIALQNLLDAHKSPAVLELDEETVRLTEAGGGNQHYIPLAEIDCVIEEMAGSKAVSIGRKGRTDMVVLNLEGIPATQEFMERLRAAVPDAVFKTGPRDDLD